MATLTEKPKIELTVNLTINESEARTLDVLVGYDFDAFLKAFYTLGKHYMQPNEAGLKSFFTTVRQIMPGILERTDKARKTFVN